MTNTTSTSEIEPQIEATIVGRQQETAARAHELWVERGRPLGSPDKDWFRAEQEVQRDAKAANTASKTVDCTADTI